MQGTEQNWSSQQSLVLLHTIYYYASKLHSIRIIRLDHTPPSVFWGDLDISIILQYSFYQSIYYSEKATFPTTNEKYGHWLGVAENMGDTLTYWILTDKNIVIARSLVRPMEDYVTNKRCILDNSQVNVIGERE